MVKLREYQQDLVNALRYSSKRSLAVSPTGSGKTIMFSFITNSAISKGKNVLILTDRIELLTQSGGALTRLGLKPEEITAGSEPDLNKSLYISMVETLNRRLDQPEYQALLKAINLLIIDEAHKRSFDKILDLIPSSVKVLGFTATPHRAGKKNQLIDQYREIVEGVSIPSLIKLGYLAKPNYYGVEIDLSKVEQKRGDYDQNQVANEFSKNKIFKGVVANWLKLTPNTKTIIFSSNINSSKEVCEAFLDEGYECRHLDSKMGFKARKEVLSWFASSENGILSNVGILTTGFDDPNIETVILYRATRSLPLYLQMVGRGSRVTDSKSSFNVLDFGNNITTHGFWHEDQIWSLEYIPPRPLGERILKNCKDCGNFIQSSASVCPSCGYVYTKLKREQKIAELKKLDPKDLRNRSKKGGYATLLNYSKAGLVSPYWALHQINSKEDAKKFIKDMGWKSTWYAVNKNRYKWS